MDHLLKRTSLRGPLEVIKKTHTCIFHLIECVFFMNVNNRKNEIQTGFDLLNFIKTNKKFSKNLENFFSRNIR